LDFLMVGVLLILFYGILKKNYMICKKIQYLLNEAKLKGLDFIEIEQLTENEIEDIQYCGFNITYKEFKFKISF
jgi:hypothetical protein